MFAYVHTYRGKGGPMIDAKVCQGTGGGFRPSRRFDARRIGQNALDIVSSVSLGENGSKTGNLSPFLSPCTFKQARPNGLMEIHK
jgi:hypothetical protein